MSTLSCRKEFRMNATRDLKQKMASGAHTYAVLVGPGNDPLPTVDALKAMGCDLVMVDREHSLVNPETVLDYVRAGKELGVPIIVRPEEYDANWRCYLDSGVSGLMLPMVDTVDQAVRAVDRAYFPPIGHRGYGLGMSPFPLDGMDPGHVPHLEMTAHVNDNTLLLPQTESLQAVSNLKRILALEGVTGTVVGTFDLALDIGGIAAGTTRVEMTRAAEVEAALAEVGRICRSAGKIAGIGGVPPEDNARWAEYGYRLFVIGTVTDGNLEPVRWPLQETKRLLGG
jgi:4-hydroxy-2-oxoheptanedioate aldolase